MGQWVSFKQQVLEMAQEMFKRGLVGTASGNASMRISSQELIAITPTRVPYDCLTREDIVIVDFHGATVDGQTLPSSELLLHVEAYKARGDVSAVLHTHSTFATVASVAGLEIPPIMDEMVVYLGGAVRVADYAFPSTRELAHNAMEAMGNRNAVLLRNHGVLGVGRTPEEVLEVCEILERTSRVFVYARLLEAVHMLPPEVVKEEERIFKMGRLADGARDAICGKRD